MRTLLCAASLLVPSLALAEDLCPSEFSKVAPSPSELAKLCPDEKAFAQPAAVQNTGNPLFCSYTYGGYAGLFRVGSNNGTTMAEAAKATDPKKAADAVAQGLGSSDIKATVVKLPWDGT